MTFLMFVFNELLHSTPLSCIVKFYLGVIVTCNLLSESFSTREVLNSDPTLRWYDDDVANDDFVDDDDDVVERKLL